MDSATKDNSVPLKEKGGLIHLTVFDDLTDTIGRGRHKTFEQLTKKCKLPELRKEKKFGKAFNLTEYGRKTNAKGSLRWQGNIVRIYGIAIDIDNTPESLRNVRAIRHALEGIQFVGYTTWSSTPEQPRCRLIILFKEPLSASYHGPVFDYFNARLDGCLDPSGRQPNQIYLLPACHPKKKHEYRSFSGDGERFDPVKAGIKPAEAIRAPKRKAARVEQPPVDFTPTTIDLDKLPISDQCRSLIVTGDASDYGGDRSAAAFAVISQLLEIDATPNDMASILLDKRFGISARHLEKGANWTVREVQRSIEKAAQSKYRPRPNTSPHYPQRHALSAQEASKRLKDKIQQAFSERSGFKGLRAPAGIGKTQWCLDEIASRGAQGERIEYYAPTHRLAEEVKDRLLALNPDLEVEAIRGREHSAVGQLPLCQKANLAGKVARKGLPVYSTLCKSLEGQCEHFKHCPYLAQFKLTTQVRIYTHAHLPLNRSLQDWDAPDFAVIDESFWPTLIDTRLTTLKDLHRHVRPRQLASAMVKALKLGKPLLEVLREKFGDRLPAILDEALSKSTFHGLPELMPGMNETAVLEELDGYRPPKALVTLLKNLRAEIEHFPERRQSRVVRYRDAKVSIANRKPVTRFNKPGGDPRDPSFQIPVLCIDADFDKEIAEAFLPGIRQHSLITERNAHVTQVSSTRNAKTRYLRRRKASTQEKSRVNRHRAQTQAIIDRVAARHRLLVVGPQAVVGNPKRNMAPKLSWPDDGEFAHFGGLRGVDEYKDFDAVVVIGRNQPRIEDLEDIAASLWWDDPHKLTLPGQFSEVVRGYRLREGEVGVLTVVHRDQRVNRVLEQIRERETLQAIDRLRLIHNSKQKHVWILSNLPLDLTIDQLVTWRELANDGTPMERAFRQYKRRGVMPLSPQLLHHRHPDLFPSENAAKQSVRRFKKGGSNRNTKSDRMYLKLLNTKCHFLSYRVDIAPGPHKTALLTGKITADRARAELEKLHGTKVTLIDADKLAREGNRPGKTAHGAKTAHSHRFHSTMRGTKRPRRTQVHRHGLTAGRL